MKKIPRWLICTLLTMLLWGVWGFLSKPVADRLSSWQTQTVSAAGLLPVIGFLLASKAIRNGARPRRGFWLAFGSGVIGSVGNVAYYAALGAGGKAAAVTPITAMYPAVTIGLAILLLRERLNPTQFVGVVLSLIALYVFNVGADSAWLSPWLALALIPVGLWGVAALMQKYSANDASGELATLGFLLGILPVSLLTPLWVSMNWRISADTWGLGLLLGLAFGLGNLTLIFAYGSGGKASVVTPMAGLYSLVTIPLAVFALGEKVAMREAFGIGLALLAALALSYEKPPGPSQQIPPPG
jgi:uncharacterized membrane protein